MRIHDTLSGSKRGLDGGKIRIYLCGVTVYDDAHIGHARTIIVFDVLQRYLEARGKDVEIVQNFTDIDDKIVARARGEGVPASEISSRYTESYFADFGRIRTRNAAAYPKATEHIGDIIRFIGGLVDGGFAYAAKNGVYFRVSRFPGYGKLSGKRTEELHAGARVEADSTKESPLDFALWKASEEPAWDSPWGRGRPGWHIECSAMSKKYLGDSFEIHGGGRDLIFPHHENEIAQSEALTGKQPAMVWMHVGMVKIQGQKMSKSLGNIRTVRGILDEWGPNVLRLFCLSGHYSQPIDYTEELLRESLVKWRQAEACYFELVQADGDGQGAEDAVRQLGADFDGALEDDLNTHLALLAFFGLASMTNRMASDGTLSKRYAEAALPEFERMAEIFGLYPQEVSASERQKIESLVSERKSLRESGRFEEADMIRSSLDAMGVEIKDHKKTTSWIKKEEIGADS